MDWPGRNVSESGMYAVSLDVETFWDRDLLIHSRLIWEGLSLPELNSTVAGFSNSWDPVNNSGQVALGVTLSDGGAAILRTIVP